MLDRHVAELNFAATGYQPPQVSLDPDSLVRRGMIPANLATAVVRPHYFDVGYRILELTPANQDQWQRIWKAFKTR
jgi:spermidine/putrescine transport system substrate-binding protein